MSRDRYTPVVLGRNEDDAYVSLFAFYDVNDKESKQNYMGANIYFEVFVTARKRTYFSAHDWIC